MSAVERPELKEYLVTGSDLSVKNAKPDILVNMTVRDYLMGRDPALDAIVAKGRRH